MNLSNIFKKCGLVSFMPMYICKVAIYINVYLYRDKSYKNSYFLLILKIDDHLILPLYFLYVRIF